MHCFSRGGNFVGTSQPLKSSSSDVKAIKRFSQVTELPRIATQCPCTLVLSQIPLDAIVLDINKPSSAGSPQVSLYRAKKLFGISEGPAVREFVIFKAVVC